MGRAITRDEFAEHEYERFEARLQRDLEAFAELLSRPGFGVGPMTMGAELELHLVDARGRPHRVNRQVVEAAGDERVTIEIAKYNVEVNTRPAPLAERAFQFLSRELEELIASVRGAAAGFGARPVAIGILPTLERADLTDEMLTDAHRYRALARGARRLRGGPSTLRIDDRDGGAVEVVTDGVAVAGANTSFQVQLRVCPNDYARAFNAVQLATAPALAASGNSPLFLGRQLWDETRIALFAQGGFDVRRDGERWRPPRVSFGNGWCNAGVLELFAESVAQHPPIVPAIGSEPADGAAPEIPMLDELRLHQGTVWRWNRAVYDHTQGGHVRIEMRALPAGPTVIDMVANAAFLVGLALGLAPEIDKYMAQMPFALAQQNFFEAAKHGLDAAMFWPTKRAPSPRIETARSLVHDLLPLALRGLASAGVRPDEAEPLLAVVEARARSGRTGSSWQRHAHDGHVARMAEPSASCALLDAYMSVADLGRPVHEWQY